MENMDEAEWAISWGIDLELNNDLPILYQDIELSDSFVETDKQFLGKAQESGYLSEGWQEGLEYRQIDPSSGETLDTK